MIKINISIPFYNYNNDIHRYKLTEKIFEHLKNIKSYFKDIAIFTFILIGSEQNSSRDLALRYFDKTEYFEFDQNDPRFNGDLLTMLYRKSKIWNGIIQT